MSYVQCGTACEPAWFLNPCARGKRGPRGPAGGSQRITPDGLFVTASVPVPEGGPITIPQTPSTLTLTLTQDYQTTDEDSPNVSESGTSVEIHIPGTYLITFSGNYTGETSFILNIFASGSIIQTLVAPFNNIGFSIVLPITAPQIEFRISAENTSTLLTAVNVSVVLFGSIPV